MNRRDELELSLIESIQTADAAGRSTLALALSRRYLEAIERTRPALLAAREAASEWRAAIEMEEWGSLSMAAVIAGESMDAALRYAETAELAELESALRDFITLAIPDKDAQERRHLAVED